MKKALALIILTSMMLHCASRLGLLDYLYQQRHQLAYHAGLISELPIAICSSDHHLTHDLVIIHQDSDQHVPVSLSHAAEIILFFESQALQLDLPDCIIVDEKHSGNVIMHNSDNAKSIFHPPSYC
jgi:hypothetical protein